MDVLGFGEDIGADITQGHIVHRALVGEVSAVFVVTHTDSSACGVLVLTNEKTGVDAFLLQAGLNQVAKAVIAYHTAESHFSPECSCVGGKDSRGTAEGEGHLFGKLLLAYFGLTFNLIEDEVYVEFA